jgi:hypothetical protein
MPAPAADAAEGESGQAPEGVPDPPMGPSDPQVTLLEAWLKPFRDANQAAPVAARFSKLLATQREAGPVSADAWRLAFQLAPGDRALAQALDAAWFRGELPAQQLGPVLEAGAGALDLKLWLARWPRGASFAEARRRALILAGQKQPAEAVRGLLADRAGSLWSAREEVLAFDLWQRLGASGTPPPAYWAGAADTLRRLAGGSPDGAAASVSHDAGASAIGDSPLEARLKAHPHDVLSARRALASLAPAPPGAMDRAALVLRQDRTWYQDRQEDDLALLRLRAIRAGGPGAGAWEAGRFAPALAARPFKPSELDQALADLARAVAAEAPDQAGKLLALLQERHAAGLPELQAELARAGTGQAEPYLLADGKPRPIRPRDLTWTLLGNALWKEGVR